ncbi:outer membrane beta-barrel protein [Winogradskyella sp. PC D3.3]
MTKLLIYLLLILFPLVSFSQIKITGQILDTNNNPIEFAKVTLLSLKNEIVKGELSNETGDFIVELNTGGPYQIQISYFQNILFENEITITKNMDLGVIKAKNSILLDDIVIKAYNQPKIVKKIGKYIVSNIASSPLSKNRTTFDFLGTIPFVNNGPDGNSITIKNRKEAKILINGREVGDKEIALNILKSTPAEDIKKIEIITSPSSKYSASTQNGIVNVVIKKSNEGLKGAVSSGVSQSYFNSQNANANLTYSKINWFVSTGIGVNNYRFKSKQNSIYKDYINQQQTQIEFDNNHENKTITPFVNIHYDLTPKQSIGAQFNSSFRNNSTTYTSQNEYTSLANNSVDSLNQSTIKSMNPNFKNLFLNANYTLKTDTIGSNFELNLYRFSQDNNPRITNNFQWNNESQSILQQPNVDMEFYNVVADYTQNFENEDVLKFGVNYSNGQTNNRFFHGNYDGAEYVSDTLRTNNFKYKDNTFAAYLMYQKLLGDNWEMELGLRWENYEGEGVSENTSVEQKNNYLFPAVSVLFYANDSNEFSLDYRSSIIRPPYSNFNPNSYYTSANSYKRNNPNLLPILSHSVAFNYSFLKHYSLDVEYDYAKNTFNKFDIVQPNGLIETVTDNYGKGYELYFGFTYNKHFFNNKWNFTASLFYMYDKSNGNYNGIDLGFDNTEWGLGLKNFVYLNKSKDAILNLSYGYGSANKSILGEMNAMHSLTFELSKTYKKFNFTLGAYDLLRPTLELREERIEYGFYKRQEYFKTAYFRVSYFFGNRKVKSISNKQGKMSNRIE